MTTLTPPPLDPPQRVLLGPGPSDVPARVLQAMAAPTMINTADHLPAMRRSDLPLREAAEPDLPPLDQRDSDA